MSDYEERRRKEREALDAKFRAASAPLADTIVAEVQKATGLTLKRSVHEGSHAVSLWLDEPRVSIEIAHDWGAGHRHYSSQPLGTPKIGLNAGRHSYGKTWYRPGKDGTFNLSKIVKHVADAVDRTKQQKEWDRQAKEKQAASDAAYKKDLAGIKLPESMSVSRNHEQNSYQLKFAGTFEDLTPGEVAQLALALEQLTKTYTFTKSWRTELF